MTDDPLDSFDESEDLDAVFTDGWDAYVLEQDSPEQAINPHEYGSPEWGAWQRGYRAAEQDHRR